MYLIAKWFGIFLLDNKRNIIKKHLFKKEYNAILKVLIKIEKNEILNEEKKIIKGFENDKIIVNEKRLIRIGEFKPSDKNFNKITIKPNDFNFSLNILLKASLIFIQKKIDKELKIIDYQIIQMIKSYDNLVQISNMLSERLDNWLLIKTPKYKINPFIKIIKNIQNEINRLEKQIKIDIEKTAPNCCSIIGPMITARLIALAGNMENLSKKPASTIQILGAENAFFRYKKEGGKNPKHGIIYQNKIINQSSKKFRGKISRILAAKLSIAINADFYTKKDISKLLKKEIEIKLKELKINYK